MHLVPSSSRWFVWSWRARVGRLTEPNGRAGSWSDGVGFGFGNPAYEQAGGVGFENPTHGPVFYGPVSHGPVSYTGVVGNVYRDVTSE